MIITVDPRCNISIEERVDEYERTINSTFSSEPFVFKTLDTTDYIQVIAIAVIIVGGLLGNISVVLTVVMNRSMRTTINFYVANLAVADAMICIICMIPKLIGTMTKDYYALGEFMCKFNPFTQMACLTCSVLTLSAISCDRFMAIMFPLHVRITKQRTSIVMKIIWLISILVSIPFLIFKIHEVESYIDFDVARCREQWPLDIYYDESIGGCLYEETLRKIYYIVVSVTLYFLPIGIMITAYSLILWKLWISEVPGERHAANINVQYRARKKVIKMVCVVLVAFIVCWTPFQVVVLHSAYSSIDYVAPKWMESFVFFAYYIAFANSFINPIIYGGFNKSFRDGFCVMLRCGIRPGRFTGPLRSRLTFTTGLNSSPSRLTSRTLNGANKTPSQKSSMNIEMKNAVFHAKDGEISPNMKDTCVSIADGKGGAELT